MKTYLKILGILVLTTFYGCTSKDGSTSESSSESSNESTNIAARPKKVVSVADLAVQHLINSAPDSINMDWVARLKKMRSLDQKIKQVAIFRGKVQGQSDDAVSSMMNQAESSGASSRANGNYMYMQSCCLCNNRCCGCPTYLISTQDVTSINLIDSTGTSLPVQHTDDNPARLFPINAANGDYTLTINYVDSGVNKSISLPVKIENKIITNR